MSVSMRYALRTLSRNRVRTLVSLLGLGLGGMVALLTLAWMRGESTMIASSCALGGQGYLQVVPTGWRDSRDPRLRVLHHEPLRAQLRRDPAVILVAPQLELQALLGMGTKVQGVGLLGVDPVAEVPLRRAARGVTSGRYLRATDTHSIVLGAALAERLDVTLDDELVVTAVKPDGDMSSVLLSVVGLIETGSRMMDSTIAHTPLATAVQLSGQQGVSRLALLVEDPLDLEPLRGRLRDALRQDPLFEGAEVLTWTEVNPAMVAGQKSDEAFGDLMVVVVSVLVILGITSAQLTGVLQRGREFSVLLSLGMPRASMWRLVLSEAGLLGFGGGLVSLAFSAVPLWYLSQVGVDLTQLMGAESMAMGGVLMDPILKADVGPWIFIYSFCLSLLAALLGAIYPILWSMRLDPASTLRARN